MSNAKFSHRQGDVQAMLRVMRPLVGPKGDAQSRRRFLASWCRLVGNELGCVCGAEHWVHRPPLASLRPWLFRQIWNPKLDFGGADPAGGLIAH